MNESQEVLQLNRGLGLKEAIAFGIGGMIGAGVFALSGELATKLGIVAILVLFLASSIALSTGWVYSKFSYVINDAGGGYSYVKSIGNTNATILSGILFFIAYSFAAAFYAGVFGIYLQLISGFPFYIFSFSLIAMFLVINLLGVEESGMSEALLTGLKVSIIVALIFAGFMTIRKINVGYISLEVDLLNIILYTSIIFIAFEGFDIISNLSKEIKEPKKNVPYAIMSSIIIVALIYILVTLIEVVILNLKLVPTDIYAEEIILYAGVKAFGISGYYILSFGAIISTLSAYNAALIAVSRLTFAMSYDGILNHKLKYVNPKTRVPQLAIILSSLIVSSILIFSALFSKLNELSVHLGMLASFSFALAFLLVHLAYIINLRRGVLFKPKITSYFISFYGIFWVFLITVLLLLEKFTLIIFLLIPLVFGYFLLRRNGNKNQIKSCD